MAVTEALMCLFLKEQVSPERASAVIGRMVSAGLMAEDASASSTPKEPEEALLKWADACCRATRARANQRVRTKDSTSTTERFHLVRMVRAMRVTVAS